MVFQNAGVQHHVLRSNGLCSSCSVYGQTQINNKVTQKIANKVDLDIPWNMVPFTLPVTVKRWSLKRPWREANFVSGNPSSSSVPSSPSAIAYIFAYVSVFQRKVRIHLQPSLRNLKTSGTMVFSGFGFCVTEVQTRYNSLRNKSFTVFQPYLSHIHRASSCQFENREATRKPSPGSSANLRFGNPHSRGPASSFSKLQH